MRKVTKNKLRCDSRLRRTRKENIKSYTAETAFQITTSLSSANKLKNSRFENNHYSTNITEFCAVFLLSLIVVHKLKLSKYIFGTKCCFTVLLVAGCWHSLNTNMDEYQNITFIVLFFVLNSLISPSSLCWLCWQSHCCLRDQSSWKGSVPSNRNAYFTKSNIHLYWCRAMWPHPLELHRYTAEPFHKDAEL